MRAVVKIGGASAFWGDSVEGPIQLAERGDVDYMIFDYLAETTMAILAGARAKNPAAGFATDFVDLAMRAILPTVSRKNIKILANAGGVNPRGCAAALSALAKEQSLSLRIAVVEGDDINDRLSALAIFPFADEAPERLPARTLSANAYLGATPIVKALEAGADVVITGRCVDSALTLAPLIHEFGWSATDYDRLAAGSLAGHIIECGCQATGGLHTDWQAVPNWPDIGYPIIECTADGAFTVTKPAGTGGLIRDLAVAEQLLYEIGDPANYRLPDVNCDFTQVRIEQQSAARVKVSGARGSAATDQYKVSATYRDGYRSSGTMIIIGIDAAAKARRTGEAILARTRTAFRRLGLRDYTDTLVEVIGAETQYGPHARLPTSREVMMRVTVTHTQREALELFGREIAPAGCAWSPGTTMPPQGRPVPAPLIKQFNCLVPKKALQVHVTIDDTVIDVNCVVPSQASARQSPPAAENAIVEEVDLPEDDFVLLPLVALACARSGDKGDISNVGVIARKREYIRYIRSQLTTAAVLQYFAHLVTGPIVRYELPGTNAFNFVIQGALAGGGPASLRMDPLGKGMAQMLLDFPMNVPRALADSRGQPSALTLERI